jgi:hypothetical protein
MYHRKLRILRAAVLHRANASGKTKLFESLAFFRKFLLDSSQESRSVKTSLPNPSSLEETKNEPSDFRNHLHSKQAIFRYGFEVTRSKFFPNVVLQSEGRVHQIFYRDTLTNPANACKVFPERKPSTVRELGWGTMRSCFCVRQFNELSAVLLSSGSNTV